MPMTTSSSRPRRRPRERVEQRDDGLAALEREALLADELGLQEGLERLGRVELAQDPRCSSRGGLVRRSTRSWIHLRCSGSWMCMNSMPTVRQYESRSTPRMSRSFIIRDLPAKPPIANSRSRSHRVRPCVGDLEVGVAALAVLQRVGVGHHVAAHPVGVDQLEHPGRLATSSSCERVDVLGPADRLVGDAQRLEDLVVEAVLAEQQRVHVCEELAGRGALDDPVVVGRRQRHHLGDAQVVRSLLGRALELRPGSPWRRRP